ncbi:MFS transporter [Corynebacterium bovis]|uniref:MFS transporter n=1 Tax=Corynebacterium bovis TaxID=36808 RepID=UPI00244B7292|nr:MFS transporter [Corynebacterium bovis]MDH2455735.1 MFS transporter [Corynebacterium bovis]
MHTTPSDDHTERPTPVGATAPPATPAQDTAVRSGVTDPQERRRILGATLVGTTIEWYDFFIYAQAAGLVFATQFFRPLGEDNASLAQIVSWASLGISFLFRPLGAAIAGHLGDRYGRKVVLAMTLILMGTATALIGVLPTYSTIGAAAPVLLIVLRIVQGFSAGGEWGGAALLSVEHAPRARRGYFGSFPQLGVPIGLGVATGVLLVLNLLFGRDGYQQWAWRVPFILSFALIIVGVFIRRRVSESPVFEEIRERSRESSAPMSLLLTKHLRTVLKAALIFAANNAAGYMIISFMGTYATKSLGMSQESIFLCIIVGSVAWGMTTLWSGAVSDRHGRVQTFLVGYAILLVLAVPVWLLIDTRSIWMFGLAVLLFIPGLSLSYGPQSALYAEMFDRSVRYSGVSLAYALGSILGGAFAPMIAELLLSRTGVSWSVGIYIMVMCVISMTALALTPRTLADREL